MNNLKLKDTLVFSMLFVILMNQQTKAFPGFVYLAGAVIFAVISIIKIIKS